MASFLVRLSWPHQGTVPRVVTQLWRPPAAWVLPPSGSLPVTRVEGQNSTEWTHRINSSEPGQGQRQKEKALVYKRSSPYRRGMKQQTAFFTSLGSWSHEPQCCDMKGWQGHRAAPTSHTSFDRITMVFKRKKWRPLRARYLSTFEALPPPKSSPSGPSLYFLQINPALQLKQAASTPGSPRPGSVRPRPLVCFERMAELPAVDTKLLHLGLFPLCPLNFNEQNLDRPV